MAQGRMIVNAICMDKRINDLSCDTSRLAFTWLITFADCEGRTYGDPAVVRSMLFPRRDDITLADMTAYMHEWHNAGLIVWYEIKGDKFVWFPAFEKNQVGLRKDRESSSRIPQPPPTASNTETETLRSNSGVTPAQIKLKDKKVIEDGGGVIPEPEGWADDPTINGKPATATSFASETISRSLLMKIAKVAFIPETQREKIEAVHSMIDVYGLEKTETALDAAFQKWVTTKKKNGGGTYSPLNFGWVEKAQESLLEIEKPADDYYAGWELH